MKDQADILVFVECLIKNTTPDDRKGSDPFWENSERLLYTALVAYLVYHARPEERNLNSLMLLLSLAEAREEDESYMSPLDLVFEELETGMRFMERGRAPEARGERIPSTTGMTGDGSAWASPTTPTTTSRCRTTEPSRWLLERR